MASDARTIPSRPRRLGGLSVLLALAMVVAAVSLRSSRSDQAAASPVPASGFPSAAPTAPGPEVTTAGPVSAADKALLATLRQAGLWEAPAGRLAQTHASSEAVKRAGRRLLEENARLDRLVRGTAQALNVSLPDRATREQLGLLKRLNDAHGTEFDELFANILRAGHGRTFVAVARVRPATDNRLVRRLATQADLTVLDHQRTLDETGLVSDATYADLARSFTR